MERMITLEQHLDIIIIAAVAAVPVLFFIVRSLRAGKEFDFEAITALLIEAADEFKVLNSLRGMEYEAFENEMLRRIHNRIQTMDGLKQDTKDILTLEVIRLIIKPHLQKIYKK